MLGTKVKFVGGSPVTYTIDFAEFYNVPAPYTIPAYAIINIIYLCLINSICPEIISQ